MRSLDPSISVRVNPVVGGKPCAVSGCHRISKHRGPDNSSICYLHFRKWRKTNDLPDGQCVVCSQPFRPVSQKVTCSKECAREWQNEWRRRLKATPEGKAKVSNDQKRQRNTDEYRAKCRAYEASEGVRERALARGRERTKRPEVKLRKKLADAARNNSPEGKKKMRARRELYIQTPEGKDAVRQGSRKRRALIRGVDHVPYSATQIYQRDRFVCQLCGTPVPKRAKWPDHLSASIDHIVPLSLGGPDAPHNVQCAHLQCNREKHVAPRGQLILEGFGI